METTALQTEVIQQCDKKEPNLHFALFISPHSKHAKFCLEQFLQFFFHFNGYIYSLKIYFLYNIRFVFFMVFLSKCAMIWCKQICSLCAITRNVAQNFQTELGPSPTLDLAVVTMRLLLMGCFCFWERNQVKWSQNFSVTYGANYAQGNKGALGSQKWVREPRLPDECQLQHKCRSIRLILKGWDW